MKDYSNFNYTDALEKERDDFDQALSRAMRDEQLKDLQPMLPRSDGVLVGDFLLNYSSWKVALSGALSSSNEGNVDFLLSFEYFVNKMKKEDVELELYDESNASILWNSFFYNNKNFEKDNVVNCFKLLLKAGVRVDQKVKWDGEQTIRVLDAIIIVGANKLLQSLPMNGYSINGYKVETEIKLREMLSNTFDGQRFVKCKKMLSRAGEEVPLAPIFRAIDSSSLETVKWFIDRKSMWLPALWEKSVATYAMERLLKLENSVNEIHVLRLIAPHIDWNDVKEKKNVLNFFQTNYGKAPGLSSINHVFGYCIFNAAKFHLFGTFGFVDDSAKVKKLNINAKSGLNVFEGFLNKLILNKIISLGIKSDEVFENKLSSGKSSGSVSEPVVDGLSTVLSATAQKGIDVRKLSKESMQLYMRRQIELNNLVEKDEINLFFDENIYKIIKASNEKEFISLAQNACREFEYKGDSKRIDIISRWLFRLVCAKNVGYFNKQGGAIFAQNCTDSAVKIFLEKVIKSINPEVLARPLEELNGLTLAHVCCVLDDVSTLNLIHQVDKKLLCNSGYSGHLISVGACAVKSDSFSCLEYLMNNLTEELILKEGGGQGSEYREHLIHTLIEGATNLVQDGTLLPPTRAGVGLTIPPPEQIIQSDRIDGKVSVGLTLYRDVVLQLVEAYPEIIKFKNSSGLYPLELLKDKIEDIEDSIENKNEKYIEALAELKVWSKALEKKIMEKSSNAPTKNGDIGVCLIKDVFEIENQNQKQKQNAQNAIDSHVNNVGLLLNDKSDNKRQSFVADNLVEDEKREVNIRKEIRIRRRL